MRNKTGIAILIAVLAVAHLVLFVAGFFAPYDPTAQDRELPYAPPMHVHFIDDSGFHLRPFVYSWTNAVESDQTETYKEDRSHASPVQFFVRGPSYKLAGVYE